MSGNCKRKYVARQYLSQIYITKIIQLSWRTPQINNVMYENALFNSCRGLQFYNQVIKHLLVHYNNQTFPLHLTHGFSICQ